MENGTILDKISGLRKIYVMPEVTSTRPSATTHAEICPIHEIVRGLGLLGHGFYYYKLPVFGTGLRFLLLKSFEVFSFRDVHYSSGNPSFELQTLGDTTQQP